jgi:hypothetical protein
LVAAGAAAYSATTVSSLRAIESTWRSAMAVDRLRAKADVEVVATFGTLRSVDDPAADTAMKDIGEEAAFRLGAYERALRGRRIGDAGVAKVRDAMAAALQFRGRQMTPTRHLIGDTPLRDAEAALSAALRKWRLPARAEAAEPRLAAVDSARANLAHWADWPTGTVLVGADIGRLYVLDVDHDRATVRGLNRPDGSEVDAIVVASPGAVVLAGGFATAYSFTPSRPAVWERPATAIAGRASGGVWVANGSTVTAVDSDGSTIGSPVTLPGGRGMVGAVGDRLVLSSSTLRTWSIEVWDPRRPATAPVRLGDGLLVATDGEHVAFQVATGSPLELGGELRIVRLPFMEVGSAELPPTDAGSGSFSPDGTDLAFPAGPLAGRIAGTLVYHSGTMSLVGLSGPSASIDGGVAWGPDGQSVFWLTPEGRIAVWGVGQEPRILRTPYVGLRKLSATGLSSVGG